MKKYQFTLVELLVVVGIIALLAGLIIPAVGMAQTSARRTACLSNQGQVMKIMRAYMNDGDMQFLPNYRISGDNYYWTQALFKVNKLQNDMTVARCPAIIPPASDAEISSVNDASLAEAYGMIYSSVGNEIGVKFKTTAGRIYENFEVAPNKLALGGCCARLGGNDQIIGRALMAFDQEGNGTDELVGRPALVHGDQVNIFFLDGHSESFTRASLYQKVYYTYVESKTKREARKVAGTIANSDKDWVLDPDKSE